MNCLMFQFLFGLVFLTICYLMSGQILELERFVLFAVIGFLVAICSEGLGLAVGSAFSATVSILFSFHSVMAPNSDSIMESQNIYLFDLGFSTVSTMDAGKEVSIWKTFLNL